MRHQLSTPDFYHDSCRPDYGLRIPTALRAAAQLIAEADGPRREPPSSLAISRAPQLSGWLGEAEQRSRLNGGSCRRISH